MLRVLSMCESLHAPSLTTIVVAWARRNAPMCGGGAGGGEDWNGGEWWRGRERSTADRAAPDRAKLESGALVVPDVEAVKRYSREGRRHSGEFRAWELRLPLVASARLHRIGRRVATNRRWLRRKSEWELNALRKKRIQVTRRNAPCLQFSSASNYSQRISRIFSTRGWVCILVHKWKMSCSVSSILTLLRCL